MLFLALRFRESDTWSESIRHTNELLKAHLNISHLGPTRLMDRDSGRGQDGQVTADSAAPTTAPLASLGSAGTRRRVTAGQVPMEVTGLDPTGAWLVLPGRSTNVWLSLIERSVFRLGLRTVTVRD